jgi:acyl transferase domain-containing protein
VASCAVPWRVTVIRIDPNLDVLEVMLAEGTYWPEEQCTALLQRVRELEAEVRRLTDMADYALSGEEPRDVARLRQLVETKDQIIKALRGQIAQLEGTLDMYRGEFGNGEGLGEP